MAWGENVVFVLGALGIGGYYLYKDEQKHAQAYQQEQAALFDSQTKNYNRIKSSCASNVAQRVRERAKGQFHLVVEGGAYPTIAEFGPSGQALAHPYFEYRVYIGPHVADPPVSRFSFFLLVASCHQNESKKIEIEIDKNPQYSALLE